MGLAQAFISCPAEGVVIEGRCRLCVGVLKPLDSRGLLIIGCHSAARPPRSRNWGGHLKGLQDNKREAGVVDTVQVRIWRQLPSHRGFSQNKSILFPRQFQYIRDLQAFPLNGVKFPWILVKSLDENYICFCLSSFACWSWMVVPFFSLIVRKYSDFSYVNFHWSLNCSHDPYVTSSDINEVFHDSFVLYLHIDTKTTSL